MSSKRAREILLVDMDSVLFDWTTGLFEVLDELSDMGENFLPEPDAIMHFELAKYAANEDQRALLLAAMTHPTLYERLLPMPGAVEGLGEMAELHEVFVCSSPDPRNRMCVPAKQSTMAQFFGPAWVSRMIFTQDKTVVHGRILLDDKPDIGGLLMGRQSWQQVVFSAPYNRHLPGPRVDDWSQWRDVIEPLLGRSADPMQRLPQDILNNRIA